jgi:hypothetical protein
MNLVDMNAIKMLLSNSNEAPDGTDEAINERTFKGG